MIDEDDGDGDAWLRQFEAGQARKEARANSTGWGCVIAIGLFILFVVMMAAGGGHG